MMLSNYLNYDLPENYLLKQNIYYYASIRLYISYYNV